MQTVEINLGHYTYPIFIGHNLLTRLDLISPYIKNRQIVIVTNSTIAPIYLEHFRSSLGESNITEVILADGEKYKTLDTVNLIFDHCLKQKIDRNCVFVALGGGVIGDMTGFAAACYQRGVRFIQVPTTLLAQVDSSVGGKTGVNHALGKNMIGAFYQPQCVLIDIDTLRTLPSRELSAGLAEVIKYGLIRDAEFFTWLETHLESLMQLDVSLLSEAIRRSCVNKAEVVMEDEFERSGARALLNYGHTFGHAIETGIGYGNWLHGEAVACGMMMAAEFSERLGWIEPASVERIRKILIKATLPCTPPSNISAEQFIDLMRVDKKNQSGQIRLVLLKNIGQAILTDSFDINLLRSYLSERTKAA